MKLLIIRHGQSLNNQLYSMTGSYDRRSPDPELTELGHLQAQRLVEAMQGGIQPWVDVLYSSLMTRALQTAGPIAECCGVDVLGHPEAYECGGPYCGSPVDPVPHPGSPRSQLQSIHHRIVLSDQATEEGWYDGQGEDEPARAERGRRVIADLKDRYLGQDVTVGLVCHEMISQYLLRAAIDFHPVNGLAEPWFSLNNTGTIYIDMEQPTPVTEIEHNGGHTERVVEWHNNCGHLRLDEISG